jgi:hypothetical protein
VECCSHVSYTHKTSMFFVSSIIWSLKRLTPAIFVLPIVIPAIYQRVFLANFRFLTLAEPFVLFFFLHCYGFCPTVGIFPIPNFPFSSILLLFGPFWALPRSYTIPVREFFAVMVFSIITGIVVAHALRGAFPLSTPAGL